MSAWACVLLLLVASAVPTARTPSPTAAAAQAVAASLMPLYTWLHAHPELADGEQQTAARLQQELQRLGLQVYTGIGGHGLVGVLHNRLHPRGPALLLRADMDALPLQEQTGLPYASSIPQAMHACGHDLHMALLVGSAALLQRQAHLWRGTVFLLAQPAEEIAAGARRMQADPRLRAALQPPPYAALAWHDSAELPSGRIGLRAGPITAHVDSVDVVVHGRGGHGARPHLAVDAVVMAADMVMALQTVVSRRIAPDAVAVVTVGQLEAGTKRNIIAQQALLRLTVRTFDDAVRAQVLGEIERIVTQVAAAHAAPQPPEVVIRGDTVRAVVNDAALVARLRQVWTAQLGAAALADTEMSTGGEDVGALFEGLGIPGVLLRLGAVAPAVWHSTPAAQRPGLHSDMWAPDAQAALACGLHATLWAVAELSSRGPATTAAVP